MSPFHVLLLAGGDTARKKQSNNNIDDDDKGNVDDDYITCRNKFQKEKATSSYHTSMPDRSGVNYTISHNLEIAMAVCCERIPRKTDGTQDEPSHQTSSSSIHRPIFPANYTAPAPAEKDNCKEGRRKTKQGIKTEPSTTSKNVYILRSGQEWHFLKLLVMYCPKNAVGHRALAMAILQQTVEWELKDQSSTPELTASSTYTKGDEQYAPKEERMESGDVHEAQRIMSFLTAGKYASISFSSLLQYTHFLISLFASVFVSFRGNEAYGKVARRIVYSSGYFL